MRFRSVREPRGAKNGREKKATIWSLKMTFPTCNRENGRNQIIVDIIWAIRSNLLEVNPSLPFTGSPNKCAKNKCTKLPFFFFEILIKLNKSQLLSPEISARDPWEELQTLGRRGDRESELIFCPCAFPGVAFILESFYFGGLAE